MMRLCLLALPLLLGGCAGSDWAAIVQALAKDPNAICVTVTTLYGSAMFDRNHGCSTQPVTVKAQ